MSEANKGGASGSLARSNTGIRRNTDWIPVVMRLCVVSVALGGRVATTKSSERRTKTYVLSPGSPTTDFRNLVWDTTKIGLTSRLGDLPATTAEEQHCSIAALNIEIDYEAP
jgi:hypothetical protein